MPKKKRAKSEIPAFDVKCLNCDRAIPKPLIYCSTKCMRKHKGIKLQQYLRRKKQFHDVMRSEEKKRAEEIAYVQRLLEKEK